MNEEEAEAYYDRSHENQRQADEAAREAFEEGEGLQALVAEDADREAGMPEYLIHDKYGRHEFRPAVFDPRYSRCECGAVRYEKPDREEIAHGNT